MSDEVLRLNLPEHLEALSILAFEDEPEGAINVTIPASYLYKLALKAYPEAKFTYQIEEHENN